MIKVSVIMPVYNDEEHLEVSISSVLNQTLFEIELICIDDGSTDNSLDILNKFSEKDNRIKVFTQSNQGSGSARNLGLAHAKGEYIAFLDSDDYIVDENSYKELYNEAKERNMDMVSGTIQFVRKNEIVFEFLCFKPIKSISVKNIDDYGLPWYFYKNIYKKSFLDEHNITFPNLLRGQDPVFLTEVLSKLNYYLEVPVIYYAYNTPGAVNKIDNFQKYYDYMIHYYEVFKLFQSNKNFENMIYEYSSTLFEFQNKEIYINTLEELKSIVEIFDKIRLIFQNFDNENILNKLDECFNKIISQVKIKDIEISISPVIYDSFSESVVINNISLKPKISLIMFVEVYENNLKDILESIVNQSLKELEIICICSDSNNELLNILKEYKKNDSRILIYSCPEANNNYSMNWALQKSHGDYVYRISSNEVLDLDFCEKIYDYNSKSQLNIQNQNADDSTKKIVESKNTKFFNEKFSEYLKLKDNRINMLRRQINQKKDLETLNQTLSYKFDNACQELDVKNRLIKDYEEKINVLNGDYEVVCRELDVKNRLIKDYEEKINVLNGDYEVVCQELDVKNNILQIQEEKFNILNQEYYNKLRELDDKIYEIKHYEKLTKMQNTEIEYSKNNGFTKNICNNLSYLYLIQNSSIHDLKLNLKLFNVLKKKDCFNIGYYLTEYPNVKDSIFSKYFSPELHYVCFGFEENKKFNLKNSQFSSKQKLLDKLKNDESLK